MAMDRSMETAMTGVFPRTYQVRGHCWTHACIQLRRARLGRTQCCRCARCASASVPRGMAVRAAPHPFLRQTGSALSVRGAL